MSYSATDETAIGIPLPSDDDYRRVAGVPYDPDKTLHVVKMLAGTEDMFEAAVGLSKAVFSADGIDPRLRQMIILRSAKAMNVPYEWRAGVILSRNNGLSDAEIEAAGSDGPVEGIAPDYVLMCQAVDEIAAQSNLTDATRRSILDRFGVVAARKLVLVLGWFTLLGVFLNGCGVPMETKNKLGSMTSPFG